MPLTAVVTFGSEEEIMRYQRAAFAISTQIPETHAFIVSTKEKQPNEPYPPPGSTDLDGPWHLVGVIHGPENLPPPLEAEWVSQVFEILEAHGLKQTHEVVN